jgi:hypothetical protein
MPWKSVPLHTAYENVWTPQPSGEFEKEISLISLLEFARFSVD